MARKKTPTRAPSSGSPASKARARRAQGGRASREPVPLKHPPSPELARWFGRVMALARELPGVEESRSYGTPAIKVKGKFMARLRSEAEGGLAIRCDFVDRQMLMQADPEVFYITEHYRDYPMVLIDLTKVRWEAMPQLLEAAWKLVAPPKLIAAYEGAR